MPLLREERAALGDCAAFYVEPLGVPPHVPFRRECMKACGVCLKLDIKSSTQRVLKVSNKWSRVGAWNGVGASVPMATPDTLFSRHSSVELKNGQVRDREKPCTSTYHVGKPSCRSSSS